MPQKGDVVVRTRMTRPDHKIGRFYLIIKSDPDEAYYDYTSSIRPYYFRLANSVEKELFKRGATCLDDIDMFMPNITKQDVINQVKF